MNHNNIPKTADNRIQHYLAFCLLAVIPAYILSPSLKWVAQFYFVFIAIPGLFLFSKWRCHIPPYSTDLFLWAVFLFWCALNGAVLSADNGGLQYIKYVFYVTLFIIISGRLACPCIFRSRNVACCLFWGLIIYICVSWLVKWKYGGYIFKEPLRDMLLPVAATTYTLSGLLAALFALLLPGWLKYSRWVELLGALIGTLFVQAFLFQNRSGLVATIVILGVAMVASAYISARVFLRLLLVLITSAGLMMVILYGMPDLVQRGSSGRMELWSKYLYEWQQCGIWLGCGPEFKSTLTFMQGIPMMVPHNIFLSFAVYNGLVALILFCLICIHALYTAWRRRDPWGAYLLAGLVFLTFEGAELFKQPTTSWIFSLLPIALIFNPQKCGKTRAPDFLYSRE
ncbi:MAG: hypothetical protein LBQ81_03705 [Zoogloeaceae bacterium]|jgi:hypothetical protein|nr:hypothetical protein [Zoogloeaceae bacterium]